MGFWQTIGRIMQGKTAFEAPQAAQSDEWDDDDSPTDDYAEERAMKQESAAQNTAIAPHESGLYDARGVKHIPVAAVDRVKCHEKGDQMEVWAILENRSDRSIELDKIVVCGVKQEIDYILSPGAQREMLIYRGLKMTHDSYKKAELFYKDTQTGDYFRADHMIEYHYEAAEKHYTIDELKLLMPIRDV